MHTTAKQIMRTGWGLCLLLPLLACAKQEGPAKTMTNEQGCTRIRSIGPQDPYKDPPPLKQACLGPYLLEIPQNYFYNQIGTEHDGSYALALEYPSLEPFNPGERMRLSVDVAVRTVTVKYSYIDRTDVEMVMKREYTPLNYQVGDPEESLDTRIKGELKNGLTPYYVDMEKVRAHYLEEGTRENAPVMKIDWHTDWYLGRDADGEVTTVIKCTPREITEPGVEYRRGKMVKSKGESLAECDHTLMMADLDTIIRMNYPREGVLHWRELETRARQLVTDSIVDSRKDAK